MKCKLCLEEKPLIKRSHIYPEFFYTDLYDSNHSIVFGHIKKRIFKDKFSGAHEPDILCKDCEALLSKYETYGRGVLYGGLKAHHRKEGVTQQWIFTPRINFLEVRGLDYAKFKLFLLSLIWRASISKQEMFKIVTLGEHEERIRSMLLNGDPRENFVYPCIVHSYEGYKSIGRFGHLIAQPSIFDYEGKPVGYVLLINGFVFTYRISEKTQERLFTDVAINRERVIRLVHIPEEEVKKMLNKYYGVDVFKLQKNLWSRILVRLGLQKAE